MPPFLYIFTFLFVKTIIKKHRNQSMILKSLINMLNYLLIETSKPTTQRPCWTSKSFVFLSLNWTFSHFSIFFDYSLVYSYLWLRRKYSRSLWNTPKKRKTLRFAIVPSARKFYIRPVNKFTCDCSLSFVFLVFFLSFRSLNRIFA